MSRGGALLIALAIALLTAGPAAAQPASLPDLEDEVMCPTCGTTLALSESPQADQIRDQIRTMIDAGLDEDEVKDELVAEYGAEVIAVPQTSGFDLAAWIVPGLGLLAGAIALGLGARRWRARAAAAEGPQEPEPPGGADERRLEQDLRRYRL